ncbi:AraC family transcriptional regulator [Acutalibacter caecimuris]|uniref:AraC family transcriptional regulator n=1 Tax=Acutalibacter caecimuris TaxID=3093657 RepID=UPI002AC93A59|nr:AraC family transcriptional regulator [Acutalibacter sp. M00118]
MDQTDLHETKIHGSPAFPYSVYHGRIPDWLSAFPLHWHESFELIYCNCGNLRASIWGQPYTLRAGDLLVILPHAVHSIEQAGPAKGDYFNLLFAPSLFQGAGGDPCYEKYVLPFVNGRRAMECFHPAGSAFNRAVTPCILALIAHREESCSAYALMVKSGLFRILYAMTRHSTSAEEADRNRLAYSRLKNAFYYVQSHYDRVSTVREAAARCGFSESYFMKLFKDVTGQSFHAYLIGYRLELAAKQLAETSYKVIDIAENCGFHNHAYFSRAFRGKYQMTPTAYRKAIRHKAGDEYPLSPGPSPAVPHTPIAGGSQIPS